MPKLDSRGAVAQLLILLILAAGIGVGVYLVRSGSLKLSPKASSSQTRIEFVDSSGNSITQTSSQQVKLKLTYVASSNNSFSVGINITGITHYGYSDTNPFCDANAGYAIGGGPISSSGSGGGANLYVDPNQINVSSTTKVTATADSKCSGNINPSFAAGLSNCKGGCGDGGVTDGCTCGGGNPKDSRACWWRWTCTATTSGSYTASFSSIFLRAPSSNVDSDLAEMQRMGMRIIRIFAGNKYIDDNEAARRLGVFLDKANGYGISAIVSFVDYYNSGYSPKGLDQYYTGSFGNVALLGHEFFATGYKGRYTDFVKTVVAANKNKSNIYAWEPGNELTDSSSPQTFISFMKDISLIIKSIDAQHDIATGVLNSAHTGLSPQDLYSQLPDVGIVTIHTYDGDKSGSADAAWAKSNNKKSIVEEFGFSGSGDRSASIQSELNYWQSQGATAVLQWGFIAKGLPDNGNGDNRFGMDTIWHTDYDMLASLFQKYNQTTAPFPTNFRVANSKSELAGASEQLFDMNGKIIDWNLTSEEGIKTVYVQFKVNEVWQGPFSAKITLITPSPTATPSIAVKCNTRDISQATATTTDGKINFKISGDASTWIADDYSGGVSNDCVGTWDNRTCNPISNGTYKWTHYWKHCEGSFDNCSPICSVSARYNL